MVTRVPLHRNKIHFMESVCRVVCVCIIQNTALSQSSYFVALRIGLIWSFRSVCVSPCFRKLYSVLSTGGSLWITVLNFPFYKPCLASVSVQKCFNKFPRRYREPRARELKKRRSKEEGFLFQNKKIQEIRRCSLRQIHLRQKTSTNLTIIHQSNKMLENLGEPQEQSARQNALFILKKIRQAAHCY